MNMNTTKYLHRVSGLALSVALMAVTMVGISSCSSDDDELVMNEKGEYRVQISMGVQQSDVITRAASYHDSSLDDFSEGATLVLKCRNLDPNKNEVLTKTSTFMWDAEKEQYVWSDIYLAAGKYDIFAVIPGDGSASFVDATETWTISEVPVVSQKDVLAAKKVPSFEVKEVKTYGPNKLELYCDHLTSKITPNMKINNAYSLIRMVYVSKIDVSSTTTNKYTATVTYNTAGEPQFSWGISGSSDSKSNALVFSEQSFDSNKRGTIPAANERKGKQLTTSFQEFRNKGGYMLPVGDNDNVDMTIRYDVYSANGTLTRQNVYATNTIKLKTWNSNKSAEAGKNYKLQIEVIPTYLYTLSDDDLVSQFLISDN